VLLAIGAFFFLWTVSPIWVPCFLGVLLAVVAAPLMNRLERRWGRHPRLLAAAITLLTLALGVGLLIVVGILVVREVIHFLTGTAPGLLRTGLAWLKSSRVQHMLERAGTSPAELQSELMEHATQWASHLTALLGSLLSVTSNGLVTLIFTAITSYYMLLEKRTVSSLMVRLLPLPPTETRALIGEFQTAAVGTVLGVGAISALQGVLAAIGFAIFRVEQPILWGAATGVASLVPAIGTGLTFVPIVISLFLSHRIGAGIGVLVWWVLLVIGVCDYVLRPRVMEGRMRIHSLLVLISLFGGLEAFGPMGILIGPMSMALFVALLRLYERNYRPPGTFSPQSP
jgi:predicted PurR-regulated permease PerM